MSDYDAGILARSEHPRRAAQGLADGERINDQVGRALAVAVHEQHVLAGEGVSGPLSELNGKFKLRVTELTLDPGGYVGEHNHVGPGIRQVTAGQMTYVLPNRTVIYNAGDFFFESGDVNHTVYNKTEAPMVHVLFEICRPT
jgi:quercetin dioxygenase-like cupin family protein